MEHFNKLGYPNELRGKFNSFIVTEFDDSMTVEMQIRVLIKWIIKNIDLTNSMVDYLNAFIDKFDKKLYDTVEKVLLKWLEDGIISDIISELVIKLGDLSIFREFDKTVMEKMKNEFYDRGLNVLWFGAVGDGITDDSVAIQKAIDFSAENYPYQQRPKVIFPSGYTFCGCDILLKSSVVIEGKAEFKVIDNLCGSPVGFKFNSVLYSGIRDLKILLSNENQTAFSIDTNSGGSGSQFNNFDNVIIEGDTHKNTIGITINKTWSNTFTNCKILRCGDGVVFNDPDSNANFFSGCEIRHNYLHANSKTAIIHRDGKNNVFRDGIIESYQDGIYVKNGTLTIDSVYTETIVKDRGITLDDGSGILNINNCLLKTKIIIHGGKSVTVTNCDMTRGGMQTNVHTPFILFVKDVKVKVLTENNNIPELFYSGRFGEFLDVSVSPSVWSKRKKINLDERYLDRNGSIIGSFPTEANVTGDGTSYRLNFTDELLESNPNNELSIKDNVFKPVEKGLYKLEIMMRVSRINNTHKSCRLIYRERGVGQKSVTLAYLKPYVPTGEDIVYLTGSILFETTMGLSGNFELEVSGTDKIIYITGNTESTILNQFSITRVA